MASDAWLKPITKREVLSGLTGLGIGVLVPMCGSIEPTKITTVELVQLTIGLGVGVWVPYALARYSRGVDALLGSFRRGAETCRSSTRQVEQLAAQGPLSSEAAGLVLSTLKQCGREISTLRRRVATEVGHFASSDQLDIAFKNFRRAASIEGMPSQGVEFTERQLDRLRQRAHDVRVSLEHLELAISRR